MIARYVHSCTGRVKENSCVPYKHQHAVKHSQMGRKRKKTREGWMNYCVSFIMILAFEVRIHHRK